jgi:elongation factor 3
MEFVNALCPEIWHVDAGRLTHKGKIAIVEDAFDDVKSRAGSRLGTPRTRAGTPASTAPASAATSVANSAATSEVENDPSKPPKIKKKKMTRNEQKATEARRAKRKLDWLTYGGEREPDTGEFGAGIGKSLGADTFFQMTSNRLEWIVHNIMSGFFQICKLSLGNLL